MGITPAQRLTWELIIRAYQSNRDAMYHIRDQIMGLYAQLIDKDTCSATHANCLKKKLICMVDRLRPLFT